MILKKLELKNFKNATDVRVDFCEKETTISGTNATGKTTIMNAYLWLLTGKDSEGRSDYEIKPEGKTAIDVEVIGSFEIDGINREFSRTYKEKWVKANGSLTKEFTGHKTEFTVDGLTTKKTEYTKLISSIFGEEIDLVSSPLGFTRMPWKKLREILVEIVGSESWDIDDIKDLLKGKSPDSALKSIKTTRRIVGEKREAILAKAEERSRDLDEGSDIEIESITEDIKQCNDRINKLNESKASGDLTEGIDDLNKEYQKAQTDLSDASDALRSEARSRIGDLTDEKQKLESYISDEKKKALSLKSERVRIEGKIEALKSDKKDLLDDYRHIAATEMKEGIKNCAACGQLLPEERIASVIERFNKDKAQSIKSNVSVGKAMAKNIELLEQKIKDLDTEPVSLEKEIQRSHEIEDILLGLKIAKGETSPAIKLLEEARDQAKQNIENATRDRDVFAAESRKLIDDKVNAIRETVSELMKIKVTHDRYTAGLKRVNELKKESKALEKEYSLLCKNIFDIEEAVRAMLEKTRDSINGLFKTVGFRLFEEQVNGGYREICEPEIDGVAFGTANNGARVKAGIEIASKLQEYFGKKLPIWVDNRESVVSLP